MKKAQMSAKLQRQPESVPQPYILLFRKIPIFEEIYPTLPDGLNGALDASRVKTYLKNSMYPLMYLFGKNSMPDVDNLLTSFYQLDDESRQEVVETIRLKLQYHRDPERAEQIKQIKGW